MAGYSGTPLARKLGVAPGDSVALLGAPAAAIDDLPPGVDVRLRAAPPCDVIVSFHTRRADLKRQLPCAHAGTRGGRRPIWVAWPKRASGWTPTSPRTSCARWRCRPAWSTTRSAPSTTPGRGSRLVLRMRLRPGRTTAAG